MVQLKKLEYSFTSYVTYAKSLSGWSGSVNVFFGTGLNRGQKKSFLNQRTNQGYCQSERTQGESNQFERVILRLHDQHHFDQCILKCSCLKKLTEIRKPVRLLLFSFIVKCQSTCSFELCSNYTWQSTLISPHNSHDLICMVEGRREYKTW